MAELHGKTGAIYYQAADEDLPGTQVCGFFNWSLNMAVDIHDVTDFCDAGIESNIAGVRRWSATAEKHFLDDDLTIESWLGSELTVRFFTRYDASPDETTVYYYEGKCFVTGIDATAPVNDVINESLTFQGTAKAAITGTGIAFVDSDPDTITDSEDGFVTAGFEAGDKIKVTGSTSNNGDYTVASVAAGTLTLVAGDSLSAEIAGDTVTIVSEVRLTTRSTAWPE